MPSLVIRISITFRLRFPCHFILKEHDQYIEHFTKFCLESEKYFHKYHDWQMKWKKSTMMQNVANTVRVRSHQASVPEQIQFCDDISDTVPIRNNGVTPKMDCNPILKQLFASIDFSESCVAIIITALTLY